MLVSEASQLAQSKDPYRRPLGHLGASESIVCESAALGYSSNMGKWLEIAQKMAEREAPDLQLKESA